MAPTRGPGPGRRQHPRVRIPYPRPRTARRPPYAPSWPGECRGEPSSCSPPTESANRPTRQCLPACGSYNPRRRAQGWRPLAQGPPRRHTPVGIQPALRNGVSGSVVSPGKCGGAFGTAPPAPVGLLELGGQRRENGPAGGPADPSDSSERGPPASPAGTTPVRGPPHPSQKE